MKISTIKHNHNSFRDYSSVMLAAVFQRKWVNNLTNDSSRSWKKVTQWFSGTSKSLGLCPLASSCLTVGKHILQEKQWWSRSLPFCHVVLCSRGALVFLPAPVAGESFNDFRTLQILLLIRAIWLPHLCIFKWHLLFWIVSHFVGSTLMTYKHQAANPDAFFYAEVNSW